MPKEFIVAIELGSSKMTGIAGQKNLDGSITVLALVEEDSSSCIRKGVIYNIDKTCQSLTNIINKLKTILKQDISQVYERQEHYCKRFTYHIHHYSGND